MLKIGLIELFKREYLFFISIIVGVFLGYNSNAIGAVYFSVSALYFIRERQLANLAIFFLVLTVLSDNRQGLFQFAYIVKIGYIFIISLSALLLPASFTKLHSFWKPFLVFFLLAYVSLIFSPIAFVSFQKLTSYLLTIWSIPILIRIAVEENIVIFLHKIIGGILVILSLGFVLYLYNPAIVTVSGRYNGLLGNPNGMGIFLTVVSAFILYLHRLQGSELFRKSVWFSLLFLIAVSIFMCNSRVSILSIAILLLFYNMNIGLVKGGVIILITVLFYQVFLEYFIEIILLFGLEDFMRINTLQEAGGRTIGFEFAWEEIKKNVYILGRGFEYTNYMFSNQFVELAAQNHIGNAHNSYLTAWLETGFFGMISLVIAWFIQFKRIANLNVRIYPAMFAVLFSTFFESWLTGSLSPFIVMLIMFLVLIHEIKLFELQSEAIEHYHQHANQ